MSPVHRMRSSVSRVRSKRSSSVNVPSSPASSTSARRSGATLPARVEASTSQNVKGPDDPAVLDGLLRHSGDAEHQTAAGQAF